MTNTSTNPIFIRADFEVVLNRVFDEDLRVDAIEVNQEGDVKSVAIFHEDTDKDAVIIIGDFSKNTLEEVIDSIEWYLDGE